MTAAAAVTWARAEFSRDYLAAGRAITGVYVLLKLLRVFVTVYVPLACTLILIQCAGVCGG
jgi:hypothetical protein